MACVRVCLHQVPLLVAGAVHGIGHWVWYWGGGNWVGMGLVSINNLRPAGCGAHSEYYAIMSGSNQGYALLHLSTGWHATGCPSWSHEAVQWSVSWLACHTVCGRQNGYPVQKPAGPGRPLGNWGRFALSWAGIILGGYGRLYCQSMPPLAGCWAAEPVAYNNLVGVWSSQVWVHGFGFQPPFGYGHCMAGIWWWWWHEGGGQITA